MEGGVAHFVCLVQVSTVGQQRHHALRPSAAQFLSRGCAHQERRAPQGVVRVDELCVHVPELVNFKKIEW